MSDEKSPIENSVAVETDEAVASKASPKIPMPPAAALIFVIMALLGVLIVVAIRGVISGQPSVRAEDISNLQAEVNARRNELNRQRIAMGLAPLEGTSEPIDAIANRLKADADTLVALAARFQEMLAEKDSEITAKNAEWLRAEQLRQTLASENSRLQAELGRALAAGSDGDRLRSDLANLKSQRDALADELNATLEKLKTVSAGVSEEDYEVLERQLEEALRAKDFFEARVKQLEGDLSKAKLFASSENELLPAAVQLFRSLRELEGRPDSELTTSYSNLGVELGASVLHTLPFATGSAGLTPADEGLIRGLVNELPEGDLLFVVGYASETGNEDGNRKLSSDRATSVAELYSSLKRPTQLVQAVYLGQTDRFSSRIPERNQLCEIWRIRKK
jgi:outer membrane protein OmpA-like peptidoglycan-associated protein/xanthosine utilization system XapX-like protein